VIGAGSALSCTVKVQVPAAAGPGLHSTIIDARSFLPPNLPESVRLITQTAAVATGVVFEDRDQNGVFSAGDIGVPGVTVVEQTSGLTEITDGAGRYTFLIAAGTAATIIEQNPSGFISLSPDTVGPTPLVAGDTLRADFADVAPLRLTPGIVSNGVACGFVDFPHRLDASTTGQVVFTMITEPEVVTSVLLDENGNGVFDGSDRQAQPADLYMNPPAGDSTIHVLLRVFVPATYTPGRTFRVDVEAQQLIEGTSVTAAALASDGVLVVANPIGRVALQKQVDLESAAPGDVITYSISFFNAGIDSVQNIVILDPVSQFVDPVNDAFGPGMDVEWSRPGLGPQYLTLDPVDGDECEYSPTDRVLRLIFSKTAPYFLQPGERGTLSYKVVVR
jgi:uncharacterized repeat protein (TIGR01451 family)